MNLQAFPLAAVVILSFTNKIGTWWGIAIMAACLVLGLVGAVVNDQKPEWEGGSAVQGEDILGFFVVTLPAFAAAIGGHFVRHGWGALVGGVVVALVCSVLFGLFTNRLAQG